MTSVSKLLKDVIKQSWYIFIPLAAWGILYLVLMAGEFSGLCKFDLKGVNECFGNQKLGEIIYISVLMGVIAWPLYFIAILIFITLRCALRFRSSKIKS